MIRRITLLATVAFLTGTALAGLGLVAPVAAAEGSSAAAAPAAIAVDSSNAFGTNVSVPSDFQSAASDFEEAAHGLENASESLNETASEIESTGSYNEDHHGTAADDLAEIENGVEDLEETESTAAARLQDKDSGLSPAEQFLVLEAMDEERRSTEATVEGSLQRYDSAVGAHRATAQSTVLTYFGGAAIAGLLGGILLGAVVPLMEARNVRDQMKLSRNVSYNRRAGLVPIAGGLVLALIGTGVLWYIGAIDVIGVII
jgi:hypothetical protein